MQVPVKIYLLFLHIIYERWVVVCQIFNTQMQYFLKAKVLFSQKILVLLNLKKINVQNWSSIKSMYAFI